MPPDTHPPRDSPEWDNPDVCPFCGADLPDGGAGFMDHVDEAPECRARFEAWVERVRDDIGGDWSG
jgi:hypothetical protein